MTLSGLIGLCFSNNVSETVLEELKTMHVLQ